MHILIIGLNQTRNLGDPLLLACTEKELKKSIPNLRAEIVNITGDFPLKAYTVPSVGSLQKKLRRSKVKKFVSLHTPCDLIYRSAEKDLAWELAHGLPLVLRKIRRGDVDLVLFGGGQMFMYSFILPMQEIVRKCSKEQIPVLFHACGFGPIDSHRLKRILLQTLSDPIVKGISVRDFPEKRRGTASEINVQSVEKPSISAGKKKIAYKKKIAGMEQMEDLSFTADMGLWADEVYAVGEAAGQNSEITTNRIGIGAIASPSIGIGTISSPTIGIGVIASPAVSLSREVYFFTQVIRLLEQDGQSWQLFTNGHPDDERVARMILDELKMDPDQESSASRLFVPETPDQLVDRIRGYQGILSCRLHSHIIAASCQVPSVAVSWDRKLPAFFTEMGCPDRCLTFASAPERALKQLKNAEKNGWNEDVIHSLRERSLQALVDSISMITGTSF